MFLAPLPTLALTMHLLNSIDVHCSLSALYLQCALFLSAHCTVLWTVLTVCTVTCSQGYSVQYSAMNAVHHA